MSEKDTISKITELLSESCKSGPDMTHALKTVGDGSMKKGIGIIKDYFIESGVKQGNASGMLKGTLLGTGVTLSVVGLIVLINKAKSGNDEHKKKGEDIIKKLEESVNTTEISAIGDLDTQKESNEDDIITQ